MSGWQRLGVVLSFITALLIVCLNFDSFPTQKKAYAELGDRVEFWMSCEKYYRNETVGRVNNAVECSEYARQNVRKILQLEVLEYKTQISTLTERQWVFVANYFAWWIGINQLIYVMALSAKWVCRGFRPKKTSQL